MLSTPYNATKALDEFVLSPYKLTSIDLFYRDLKQLYSLKAQRFVIIYGFETKKIHII